MSSLLLITILFSIWSAYETKTIISIFAGREKYLRILKRYLEQLIDRRLIQEVHMWDYTRNDNDKAFLEKLCLSNKAFIYKSYNKSIETGYYSYGGPWRFYYEYYAKAEGYNDNDIIIKCDDDIVYIDVGRFQDYLNVIKGDGLYFANIVNNDVCAYIQTKHNVHNLLPIKEIPHPEALEFGCTDPLSGRFNSSSGWWMNPVKAKAVHNHFLRAPKKFIINQTDVIHWGSRISINFFGSTVALMKRYFRLYLDNSIDDEAFLSAQVLKLVGSTNRIVPFFNVVHFSFTYQQPAVLDRLFLQKYMALFEFLHVHKMVLKH